MEEVDKIIHEICNSSDKEQLRERINEFFNYQEKQYGLDAKFNKLEESKKSLWLMNIDELEEIFGVWEEEIAKVLINSEDCMRDVNIVMDKVPRVFRSENNINILKRMPNKTREYIYENMPDEEKNDFAITKKEIVLMSIDDDEPKLEYVEKKYLECIFYSDFKVTELITSLGLDENKIDSINRFGREGGRISGAEKIEIIKSLASDELKVKIIESIIRKDEENEFGIYLKNIKLNNDDVIEILGTLKDDKIAVDYLKKVGQYDIETMEKVAKSPATIKEFIKENSLLQQEKIKLISNIKQGTECEKLIQEETNLKELSKQASNRVSSEIGLPKELTFGIELEAEGLEPNNTRRIFRALKEEKLNWEIKGDITLDEGTEMVSPILKDTPEDIHQIEYVSTMMRNIGFSTENTCGGHIHFGADFLDIDDGGKKGLENLLSIWKETEELFYKISNEQGEETRDGAIEEAEGIANLLDDTVKIESKEDYDNLLKKLQKRRTQGINFANMKEGKINTIEFRLPNGTIESEEIKQNIYLFGKLMTVSKDMALEPEKYESKMERLKNRKLSEAEKLEALFNVLFEKEEEKNLYRKRWDLVKEKQIYDFFAAKNPTYKRGDFSLKEEAKNFLEEVAPEEIQEFITEVRQTQKEILNEEIR